MEKTRSHISIPKRILAFDPGETLGVAVIEDMRPKRLLQIPIIKSNNIGKRLAELFDEVKPDFVCLENYRVYGTHAKSHINSELFTPQLIGRIKQLAEMRDIEYFLTMASGSKAFMTDERLLQWQMVRDLAHETRHSRDALRVGLTYLLFG